MVVADCCSEASCRGWFMHLPISRPMKDSTISAAIHQKLTSYSGFFAGQQGK